MVIGKSKDKVFILLADHGGFIVSGDVLSLNVNIVLKHNFEKLLKSLEFFCSMSGVYKLLQTCERAMRTF